MILFVDGNDVQLDPRELGFSIEWSHENQSQPNFQRNSIKIPGRVGSVNFGHVINERYFRMTLIQNEMNLETLDQRIRTLTDFFFDNTGSPKVVRAIILYENRYRWVELDSPMEPEYGTDFHRVSMSFISEDPYKYDLKYSDEVKWGSDTIDFDDPFLFGGEAIELYANVATTKNFAVEVTGLDTPGIIDLDGSAPNGLTIILWNSTATHHAYTFEVPGFTNSNLQIEQFKTYRNGQPIFIDASGFILPKGQNLVTVNTKGATGLKLKARVRVRDRYY